MPIISRVLSLTPTPCRPTRKLPVLVDNTKRCDYYRENSENVASRGRCSTPAYNHRESCEAKGAVWTEVYRSDSQSHSYAPDCQPNQNSRMNHHGNVKASGLQDSDDGEPDGYRWHLPHPASGKPERCVMRLRYNITTNDYDGWNTYAADNGKTIGENPVKDFVGAGCDYSDKGAAVAPNFSRKLGTWGDRGSPTITDGTYPKTNASLASMEADCAKSGRAMCTLGQLKAASDAGFQDTRRLFYRTSASDDHNSGLRYPSSTQVPGLERARMDGNACTNQNERCYFSDVYIDTNAATEKGWCCITEPRPELEYASKDRAEYVCDSLNQCDAVVHLASDMYALRQSSVLDGPSAAAGGGAGGVKQVRQRDTCSGPLRLNVNTAQFGRTFEDRTHTFRLLPRPAELSHHWFREARIVNLNVRGRRGNIQQVYPAVEYDFAPTKVKITQGDYIHFQWTGSDANDVNNAGNGRAGTDRSNLVMMKKNTPSLSVPQSVKMESEANTASTLEDTSIDHERLDDPFIYDTSAMRRLAYGGQDYTKCDPYATNTGNNNGNADNSEENCKTLNAASAYFNLPPQSVKNIGTWNMVSTRNNAFSNRGQKGTIVIERDTEKILAISGVTLATVGLAAAAAMMTRKNYRRGKLGKRPWLEKLLMIKKENADDRHQGMAINDEPRQWHPALLMCGACLKKLPFVKSLCEMAADQSSRFVGLVVFLLLQLAFFLFGYIRHVGGGGGAPYFGLAKAGGSMLNFNCALILIPVLRNMLSWLRTTPVGDVVPLDDNIMFHRLVAGAIAFAVVLHVACHYADFVWAHDKFGTSIVNQALGNFAGATGHFVLVAMAIMACTAVDRVRRRRFNIFGKRIGGHTIFWYCHKLWMPALLVLCFHGPVFWIYLFWPLLLFGLEKLIQGKRAQLDVQVLQVKIHENDVMELIMRLPERKFQYKAGQYLFLSCPMIDKLEWHPFTITSAPEEPIFSCHIRSRKDMDWTYKLRMLLNPGGHDSVDYTYAHKTASDHPQPQSAPNPISGASGKVMPADKRQGRKQKVIPSISPLASQGSFRLDRAMGDKRGSGAKLIEEEGEWIEAKESGTGKTYYFNSVTNETAWVRPPPPPPMSQMVVDRVKPQREYSDFNLDAKANPLAAPRPALPTLRSMVVRDGVAMPQQQPVELRVDGPYGSASEEVFGFRTLVLVGAGIGVTPFASIMKSIKLQHMSARMQLRGSGVNVRDAPAGGLQPPTIHFYWLCRDMSEFESFKGLMMELADSKELSDSFTFNTYTTGEMDLSKLHLVDNPHYKQYSGRPNWGRIFKSLAKDHVDEKVGVFMCGPAALAGSLQSAIKRINPKKGQPGTSFAFHKENF